MAKGDENRSRDPLEEGEDKSQVTRTSGNREESMTESGKDAFGSDSAVRNPDSTAHGDESADADNTADSAGAGEQRSASSGTTSLTGESKNSESLQGPGGVEGTSGNS